MNGLHTLLNHWQQRSQAPYKDHPQYFGQPVSFLSLGEPNPKKVSALKFTEHPLNHLKKMRSSGCPRYVIIATKPRRDRRKFIMRRTTARRAVWHYLADRDDQDNPQALLFVGKSNRAFNKDALPQVINALGQKQAPRNATIRFSAYLQYYL